jgi:hypothetical protein
MKRLISSIPLFLIATVLRAQDASVTPTQLSDKEAAGVVAGCLALGLVPILISIAIWLFVAIWIMRDAKKRQSPNATLVTVLGWLIWPVGLIVHLVTRPKTIPGGNP